MENEQTNGWNVAETPPQSHQESFLSGDAPSGASEIKSAPKGGRFTHLLYVSAGSKQAGFNQPALRQRQRQVERLTARLFQQHAHLDPAADRLIVRSLAETLCLQRAILVDLLKTGPVTTTGEPRRLLSEWRSLKTLEAKLIDSLGLSPASRASLKLGRGNTIFAQLAELHDEADRRREARTATTVGVDNGKEESDQS